MKVKIFTEGGKDIGFGHLTRCIALLQAINELMPGIDIEFICVGDKEAEEFIKLHKIKIKNIDWIKKFANIIKDINKNDKIIIDSYLAPKDIYFKLSKIVDGDILMIDDFNRINYPKGILVNPSIYGDKIKYKKKEGLKYLLGKDYIILRKEFWEVPEKMIKDKIKNVLITFGGMGNSGLIKKIVEKLKKFQLNFLVVDTQKKKYTADKMLKLMLESDVCISGGGQTTYELARVGVPNLGICFADNQKGNLEYGDQAGYLKYAGNSNDKDLLDKIKNKYEELTFNERIKMSEIGRRNIDGQGVKRILKKFKNVNKTC